MSYGYRLSYDEAFDLAKAVAEHLRPHVAELKCVGSLRRHRQTVGDVEFIARPIMHSDLFGGETPLIEPIRKAMLELGTWVKGGERMMQITDLLGESGVKLELYLVHHPSSWGSQLAIRTGPADLGKYCVTKMRENGFRHVDGHAVRIGTEQPVPTDTEEEFFALAGVPCVPPRERDALTARLLEAETRAKAHA